MLCARDTPSGGPLSPQVCSSRLRPLQADRPLTVQWARPACCVCPAEGAGGCPPLHNREKSAHILPSPKFPTHPWRQSNLLPPRVTRHTPPRGLHPPSLDFWLLDPSSPAQDPQPGVRWGSRAVSAHPQSPGLLPQAWHLGDSRDGSYCRAVPHAKAGWMPPTSDLGRQTWLCEGRFPQWARGS